MRAGAVALALAFLASTTKGGEAAEVHVDKARRVTLTGEHPSLATLLEELSWRAGFTLRSFDAADRAVSIDFVDMPLVDALQRLLRADSFIVGLSRKGAAEPHVAWLRVLGTHADAQARRSRSSPVAVENKLKLPSGLFRAAFTGRDPVRMRDALAAIEARLGADPTQMEALLRTDTSELAEVVAQLPDAAAYIAALRQKQTEPRLREKLDAIVALLAARPAGVGTSTQGRLRSSSADSERSDKIISVNQTI